jgi:zinc finger HIT domain-containing protein 1
MPRIELLPNQTSNPAPGWAYVPESHYIDPSKAAINPSGARARHKSAAALTASSSSDLTARQQTAIQRRLAELDRDAPTKEVNVPKTAGGGGGGGGGKTQATRKILGSMKGWRNWLDDEEAMVTMAVREGGYVSHAHTQIHSQGFASGMSTPVDGKRGKSKRASLAAVGELGVEVGTPEANVAVSTQAVTDDDAQMMDAEDCDPLLLSQTLGKLSSERLEALLSAPPLSYNAARAAPPDPDAPPLRQFCELCGYWGRVRCMKCGARICGLDCKVTHDTECSRRFA